MKTVLLLIAGAFAAFAQPSLTQIQDTVYSLDGTPYTGSLTIQGQTIASSGAVVLQNVKTLRLTAGVLNVSLVPNGTATPQFSSYLFTFGTGAQETCTIPASDTPITLAPNCVPGNQQGTQLSSVLISQLNLTGYSNGLYCIQVTNGVAVLTQTGCPGSGGGSSLSLSTLTNSQLATLTNSQLASLTN